MEIKVGNTYTTLELEDNSLQYGFEDDIFVMFKGGDSDFKVGNIYRFKFDSSFAKFADITVGDGYYPALVSYDDAEWLYLGKSIRARAVYDYDERNKNCTYIIVSESDGDFPLGTRECYLGESRFTCGNREEETYMYSSTKLVKLVDNQETSSKQITLSTSPLRVGKVVSNYSNKPMVLYYGDESQYHYELVDGCLYDDNYKPVEVTVDVLNTVVESIQMYKKIDSRKAIMSLVDGTNEYVFRYVNGIGYYQHTAHTQMTASLSDMLTMDLSLLEDVEISEVI